MKARENPFATSRVLQVRYRMDEEDWRMFLDRLRSAQYRGAIVGPEGSGKTTLLEDLELRLRGLGMRTHWLRLRRDHRQLREGFLRAWTAELGSRDCVLCDGLEQIGPWRWRQILRATRAAGGLIGTTHRPGFLPTIWECRTSVALVRGIVDQLLAGSAMKTTEPVEVLFGRHQGNVRLVLRELYDQCAGYDIFRTR